MPHKFGKKEKRGIYEVYPMTWKEKKARRAELLQFLGAFAFIFALGYAITWAAPHVVKFFK